MSFAREPDWGVGADGEGLAAGIAAVKPSFGEYLRAQVGEGFWASTTGQAIAQMRARTGGEREAPLTAEEWRQSPHFREAIPFDERITPTRARALAETFDANAYRRWLIDQRGAGLAEGTAGFVAGVVGSIPDPINFIPFAGPAFRAAQVARYGQIAGRAIVGAGEAAAGTALAQPFLITSRRQFGDDVTMADALMDIALSAFAGAAIGGVHGVWARSTARVETPKGGGEPELKIEPRAPEAQARDPVPDGVAQSTAARTMDNAMRDLLEGRPIDIGADPRVRAEMEATARAYAEAGQRIDVAGNQAGIRVENFAGPPDAAPVKRTLDFSTGADPDAPLAPVPERLAPKAMSRSSPSNEAPKKDMAPEAPAAPQPARRPRDPKLADVSTMERIRQMGGVRLGSMGADDAISSLGGRMKAMAKLKLSKAGRDLDQIRGDLAAEGYTRWDGKPLETVDDLVRTIAEEANGGRRIVGGQDLTDQVELEARARYQALVDQYGEAPDIRDDEALSLEKAFETERAIAASYEADYARLRAEAEAYLATRGEAWEPDYAPQGKPITLADLERIDGGLGSPEGRGGRGADAGPSRSAGQPADPVRGSAQEGGQGTDLRGRGEAQAAGVSPERRELIGDTLSLLDDLEADPRHAEAAKAARAELARAAGFDDAAGAAARCLKG